MTGRRNRNMGNRSIEGNSLLIHKGLRGRRQSRSKHMLHRIAQELEGPEKYTKRKNPKCL